jgi:Spy/CpxP family protein refolding chaperone
MDVNMFIKRKEQNMLRLKSKQIVLPIAVLLLVAGSAFAQPLEMPEQGAGREGMHGRKMSEHRAMIPDLTKEQQEQIKALRVELMQTMQPLRNELGEKKAQFRTLTTQEKVNMNKVNQLIDEMGKLHTKMMKLKASHQQSIRQLLTDEQRVFFDAHHPPHDGPPQEGQRPGKGMHR